MGLFSSGEADEELNELQQDAQNLLNVDQHEVELDQEIMSDLNEIHQIIKQDGNAINAIAEADTTVDLGRAIEKHNVDRSLSELHNDFTTLENDIREIISDLEEKREELKEEVQLEEKDENEFGKLGRWAETIDSAVQNMNTAQEQSAL